MKVLVIGGGGREHAIVWRLAQSPSVEKIYAAPGNPGIARIAECVSDAEAVADLVDLTVVGPEAPLVAGVVDSFRARGRAIVGPVAAAAQLEGSKIFAKEFMQSHGIPTARFVRVATAEEGIAALGRFDLPVVVKADGLAAGKGVVVARSRQEAEAAVRTLGPRLVIEEFLVGEEVSFIALCDGRDALPLAVTQDHKTLNDGDTGPNTGGMGAYSDDRILNPQQIEHILDTVIRPVVEGMAFTGFLYAGLMMTPDGPKTLEFNVRLGDPEAQAIMHRMDGDFVAALEAAAHGRLAGAKLEWMPQPSVCVVMAAHGYPGTPRAGDRIAGIERAERLGATVFQAGTKLDGGLGTPETAGGRVLGVTAAGENLPAAIRNAYAAVEQIHFRGMHYRYDIGRKGLK